MLLRKSKQSRGVGRARRRVVTVPNRVVREGLTRKVTFE